MYQHVSILTNCPRKVVCNRKCFIRFPQDDRYRNERLHFTEISRFFPMIHLGNIFCLNYQWETLMHLAIVRKNLSTFVSVVNFAPRNKEYSRGNLAPFMDKALKKILKKHLV